MPLDVEIQYTRKSNRSVPHECIKWVGGTSISGIPWLISVERAIAGIKEGAWRFWAKVGSERVAIVIAISAGIEYLKTEPDGVRPDTLLALPDDR
jgi:hypothetical protein